MKERNIKRYFINYGVSLILIISLCSKAMGQSEKLFSIDKELSSSMITSLSQDYLGNIWIGTEDGLCMYDGAKFKLFKHNKEDRTSIKNNTVTVLYNTHNGIFYIGFSNGLQVFDFSVERFKSVTFQLFNGTKIDVYVQSIIENEGEVLIGTLGHGLFSLKRNSRIAKQIEPSVLFDSFISVLYEDHNKNIWIGAEREGLLCITSRGKFYSVRNVPNVYKLRISSICEDLKGRLYIGTAKGVYIYYPDKQKFEVISGTENCIIRSLFIISLQQKLLIGTDGNGMKIYDLGKRRIVNNLHNTATFNYNRSKVRSIMEDKVGNIWLGLFQKGVLLIPNFNNSFCYMGYKSTNKNLIGSNCITAIIKDYKGNLWVASDNDEIYCIDPQGKQKAHFTSEKGNNIPKSITCFFEDSEKKIWIGSVFQGLARLNTDNGMCDYISQFDDCSIYSIVEDQTRHLWIGTMGNGLFQTDLNGKIQFKAPKVDGKHYNPKSNILNNSWINKLIITEDNKLFIGTCYGLGCYDLVKKSFVSTFGQNRILAGEMINTLFEDKRKYIWIGTTYGLYVYNPESHKLKHYDTKQGLPSNMVCGICEDHQGDLWISTNYGISKYDFINKRFINFFVSDGLQGNEFSTNSVFQDTNHTLYFGGLNGITYFKPELIKTQVKSLKLRITDFYLHDQPIRVDTKSGGRFVIDKSLDQAETIHLAANDNSFCIEFATTDYSNSDKISYVYSLNDKEWNTIQPGINRVYFSNMKPGNYTFKVKAQNYDIQSPVKEIKIIIRPFWYASWLAIMIYLFLFLIIVTYITFQVKRRREIKSKMQQQIQREEINEAKLQFFINISHEIRTPMTLIISPLRKLIGLDKDAERQKLYHTIYRNSERILLLVNQLMDIRKIDKGQMTLKFQEVDIVSFIRRIAGMFESQFMNKKIRFDIKTDLSKLDVWVDPNNFDKVIINLLANALKYTPKEGGIEITITRLAIESEPLEYYEIIVSDTGTGVEADKLDRIFERFYQINTPLNEANLGTGVGLHLTRSLVEMHHGKIWAENNVDKKGCRFIVKLPLGNSFLKPEEMTSQRFNKSIDLEPLPQIEEETYVPENTKTATHYKILIVEDDNEIRSYLHEELGCDFHIIESSNGKDALEIMFNVPIDLVVSDIMMPLMDGITFCKKMKQNIHLNHIPIILLTAKNSEEDILEGLDVGADSYITKPFHIEVLKKNIFNILHNRETLKNSYGGNQEQKDKIEKIDIKSPDEKLMERVMNEINKNIGNPNFTVEMLATEVGLSRVHLHRKLKELTNQTTRDFIRNVRLQQAAMLLKEKNQNITEISELVGFTSINYFSYAFKELYGVSPSEYKEKENIQ